MKQPRTLLITNPRASRVTPATRDLIAHALASVTDLEVADTRYADHARSLARDAAAAGAELIVAVGGDGTVNEVANGLLDAGANEAALAVVPSGGVDVFARTLGIPHDTIEAADALVRFLDRGDEPTLRSVGSIDGRAFLFNAGVGLDAAVVEAVDRHPERKRRYGDAYFAFQGFNVFLRHYPRKDAVVSLTGTDPAGRPVAGTGRFAIVALSDPWTYLGQRAVRLVPNADPTIGISVLLLESMTTLRTLRVLMRSFRGRSPAIGGVHVLDGLTSFELTATPTLPAQADGELAGHGERFTFQYRRDALRVCLSVG